MAKNVKVTGETPTGRNIEFQKPNGHLMNRPQFVQAIKQGNYPDYHIRNLKGLETPVSNLDRSKGNNLG